MRVASIRLPLAAALLTVLLVPAASARQQMTKEEQAIYDAMIRKAGVDPAMVKQAQSSVNSADTWLSGNGVVHYHIVGVYKGSPNVIGGGNWVGYADVTDRVEIDLDWKLEDSALVGTPSFKNFKSSVANVRDYERKCRAPVLKGAYEHFTVTGLKQGLSGSLDLLSTQSHPEAQVTQNCTGSPKLVPAVVDKDSQQFVVLSPVLFNPIGGRGKDVKVSADGKSLITSKDGWTWTYTPSKGR
jgi:hypothetical protein